MREIQMHPPSKRTRVEINRVECIRRLEFFAGGAELVAWVGSVPELTNRAGGFSRLHAFDFTAGTARQLYSGEYELWGDHPIGEKCECSQNPVIAPSRTVLVYQSTTFSDETWTPTPFEGISCVCFEAIVDARAERRTLPRLPSCGDGYVFTGFAFTADEKQLVAVQNESPRSVVRFDMTSLYKPPKRIEEREDMYAGGTCRAPVFNVRWRSVMPLPGDEQLETVALSSDGRYLAAGGAEGTVQVADLKRKKVLASFPVGTARESAVVRIAFDPVAEWVVALAGGRLFAHPRGAGRPWRSKADLGVAYDFAFHPTGRVLCAVFENGLARYIDPHTGAVGQSFKWSKKPKPLYSVAFAPDGLTCAAGGEDGRVILWDVDA